MTDNTSDSLSLRQAGTPNADQEIGVISGIPEDAEQAHSRHQGAAHFSNSPASLAEKDQKGSRRTARAAILIVLAILAAIYFGGVALWSQVFMPGTSINGSDVSLMSVDAVANSRGNAVANYKLAVSGNGVSLSLASSDIDYAVDGTALARDAMSQLNLWEWPRLIASSRDLTVSISTSFNEDKLNSIVDSAVDEHNKNATPSENATASYDSNERKFVITPEVDGTELNKEAVEKAVSAAVATSQTKLKLDRSCLESPSITSESQELKTAVDTANSYLAATQTLTVDGNQVMQLGPDTLAGWVKISDDLSVNVDTDAITSWANDDLAKRYDTVGAKRSYTRPDGKKFTVQGGTYGWELDAASLASTISNNVKAEKAASVEIPWSQKASTFDASGGQDWGKRYIDADLSEQHARMYDDSGKLIWESDFVSGNASQKRDTPTGVYSINSNKTTNATLTGDDENKDGEPDYISHVKYWMPFIKNTHAFHDADWRSIFGGTIYETNGSHGCINLPPEKAKELYDLCKVGDVVVVHK